MSDVTHGGERIYWEQELEFIDGLMDENGFAYDHNEPAGMYRDFARRIMLRLAELVPVVEAVAENGPMLGEYYHCQYCGAETAVKIRYHTPDCAYRRARDLCGMDGDE